MSTRFNWTCKSETRKGKFAEIRCFLQKVTGWAAYK